MRACVCVCVCVCVYVLVYVPRNWRSEIIFYPVNNFVCVQVWLDTESVYRLATETHKESAEASEFALKKLAVEKKVYIYTRTHDYI